MKRTAFISFCICLIALCVLAANVPVYRGHFVGNGSASDFIGNGVGLTGVVAGTTSGVTNNDTRSLNFIGASNYVANLATASAQFTGPGAFIINASGSASGVVTTNSFGGARLTVQGTNGDAVINSMGNFKTAAYGTPTEVNFGTFGVKTNGISLPTTNEVDIVNNGAVVVQVTNGTMTVTSGNRLFAHDGTHTLITNSSTLTASEWTAGSQFEWYNGAKTITMARTNGTITATNFIAPLEKTATNNPVDGYVKTATGTAGDTAWKAASGGGGGGGVTNVQFGLTVDGSGGVISAGTKGYYRLPYNMTLTGWEIVSDQNGSCVVDLWRTNYANFPPTVTQTITASAKPTLTSTNQNQNTTLSGWTTALSKGDYIGWHVDSASLVTRINVFIYGTSP